MDRLDAMRMFVRVVESGSFSIVAREMSIGQPAVSKQIAALEAHLGAQLMRRTSRSLSLTEGGQDFYESAVRLIDDLDAAESRVGRGQAAPSGHVRVTVDPVFGRLYIVPRLGTFFARFPEITVEFLVSERLVNLVEEGVDMAIRNGALPDSTLVARRIATTPIVTVASPAYLEKHGEPTSPSDLDRHACVTFVSDRVLRPWGFSGKSGAVTHRPTGSFGTNDGEQIRAAVLAGLGLAHTPGWLFRDELAAGSVRRVLREYEPDDMPISVVRPGGRRMASKVRVLIDFLVEIFAEEPGLGTAGLGNGIPPG
jgi:DNA-binding transcriptional LysR family regulator